MNESLRTRPAALLVALWLTGFAASAAEPGTIDARARSVERQLLPAVVTERTRPLRMSDRLQHYRIPGVNVAVVEDGRLAWSAAWGFADAATRTPMRSTTLMQSGSIAKPVAALGALRLVQDGSLSLDEPVAPRLKRWVLHPLTSGESANVSLRQLLSHDAGLTVHGFAGYAPGTPLPSLVEILDGRAPANSPAVRLDRPPGQGWRYSGGGYVVMQLLVEDVSGLQFADWMRQRVLEPAGMLSSLFGAAADALGAEVAVGHQGLDPLPERQRIYPEQAAAGLLTTPADLARLTVALQRTLAQQEPALLDLGLLQQALAIQSRCPGVNMGLGFFLEGPDGRSGFGHNGSNQGFESSWRATPTRAVIVMANANGASELIEEIVRAVAEVHGWAEWRAVRTPWRELAARYESAPVYMRGTLNEWSTALVMRRTGARRFVVDADLRPGRTEFKFATADWKQVNLGASWVKGDRGLQDSGGNLVLQVDRGGRYRFELDARDPERPVHRVRRLQ